MAFTQQSAAWHRPVFAARIFSAKRTEADFQSWGDYRDWTARKYAMWSVARSFRYRSLPNEIPTDRPYSDPEKAARRLMEHAQAF